MFIPVVVNFHARLRTSKHETVVFKDAKFRFDNTTILY